MTQCLGQAGGDLVDGFDPAAGDSHATEDHRRVPEAGEQVGEVVGTWASSMLNRSIRAASTASAISR